jgi:hypothetical protein
MNFEFNLATNHTTRSLTTRFVYTLERLFVLQVVMRRNMLARMTGYTYQVTEILGRSKYALVFIVSENLSP